jgi:hypothetical protein
VNANRFLSRISASVLFFVWVPSLVAQMDDNLDGVIAKAGTVYCMRGEQLEALTNVLKLPFDVEVKTNGAFKVTDGKERKLEDGQMIRSDGWLVSGEAVIQRVDDDSIRRMYSLFVVHGAEGLIQPVVDFVWMRAGTVFVVRDGVAEELRASMTFSNGLYLAPDASCVYPGGGRSRIVDGQLFRLDGTTIPAKDAVTLKNGTVFVQKDATLISLQQVGIIGMNEGTAVHGDGLIRSRDGTTFRLREGQTILIEGVATRR